MDRFRNINYPYRDQDDTFTARGLHLNMIVDEINNITEGIQIVPVIAALGTTDVILGTSQDIDSATINYKVILAKTIGSNPDQSGNLVVNNSSEETLPALSWTRESTNHVAGSEEAVTIEFLVVSNNLVMRITNTSGYDLQFIYTLNILKYVS